MAVANHDWNEDEPGEEGVHWADVVQHVAVSQSSAREKHEEV